MTTTRRSHKSMPKPARRQPPKHASKPTRHQPPRQPKEPNEQTPFRQTSEPSPRQLLEQTSEPGRQRQLREIAEAQHVESPQLEAPAVVHRPSLTFFSLPAEIRNEVYYLALFGYDSDSIRDAPRPSNIVIIEESINTHQPALLRTSLRVRDEAAPIFYSPYQGFRILPAEWKGALSRLFFLLISKYTNESDVARCDVAVWPPESKEAPEFYDVLAWVEQAQDGQNFRLKWSYWRDDEYKWVVDPHQSKVLNDALCMFPRIEGGEDTLRAQSEGALLRPHVYRHMWERALGQRTGPATIRDVIGDYP